MRIREATDGREIRDYSWKEYQYLKFERWWDENKEQILKDYFDTKLELDRRKRRTSNRRRSGRRFSRTVSCRG